MGKLSLRELRGWLAGRAVVRKLASNSGWLLADQMLRIGVGALLNIWIARHFGPERLGAYNYALALVALAAPLASWGLDSLLVRDLVKSPSHSGRLLVSAGILRLGTGLLSVVAAVGLASMARPGDHETLTLALIAGSAGVFNGLSVLEFWFQSQLRSKFSVLARDMAFLMSASLKIWCVLSQGSVELLSWAVLTEAAIYGLTLGAFFNRMSSGGLRLGDLEWRAVRNYLFEGRSLVLTGLLIAVYMRVDRVVIGSLLDNHAVGVYSIAVQLCEIFYVLPNVATASLYPVFVGLYEKDVMLYERRLIQIMRFFFYGGGLVALAFVLLGDWAIPLVFGPQYQEAVPVAKVYIFLLPFVGMSLVFSHRYILNKTPRYSLLGVVVGGVMTLGLHMIVVPRFGLLGAASVALVSQILPSLAVTLFVDRSVGRIFIKAMQPKWW
ncbi:flippase [Curvibacter sp. CHRR-16]|uniref:flippase n=1 Tax=Curvibacter sp. CHRR-16 TaxID=2835872 RepID=UPI002023A202|nr:flippase [Curvibacter sp. CHRR-16]